MLKALRLAALALLATTLTLQAQVIVSQYGQNKISNIAPNGSSQLFATLSNANGLALNAQGDLFAGSGDGAIIYKYSAGGGRTTFATLFESDGITEITFKQGVAVNPLTGDLYVGSYSRIHKITPDGQASIFSDDPSTNMTGLAFNSAGQLFASDFDNGTIFSFDMDTAISTVFGTIAGNGATLAFNSQDELFAANFGARIIKFSADGSTQTDFATGLESSWGLAFDSGGILYATDYAAGAIYTYTPDGTRSTYASGVTEANFIAIMPGYGAVIPEPSTWALLTGLTGFAAAALHRRRRAAQA